MTVGSVATAVHMCLRGAEAVLRRTVLCRVGARAAAGAQARATCMVEGVGLGETIQTIRGWMGRAEAATR